VLIQKFNVPDKYWEKPSVGRGKDANFPTLSRKQCTWRAGGGRMRNDIEIRKRFSASECREQFPVAADPDQRTMKSYDAVLAIRSDYANRVSYVIEPGGKIVYQYTSLNPAKHVENTLNALKSWRKSGTVK
jgi:hypothetical protein